MGEIKGQLLGIILTIMVFGGVSAVVATVYNTTADKVTRYAENVENDAAIEIDYSIPSNNGLLHY